MNRKTRKFEIVTRRGTTGPLMHFDGRKFTNNGRAVPFSFARGSEKARELLKRFEVLRLKRYHVWLRPIDPARKNPESAGIEQAARKLVEFSGHDADKVLKVDMPAVREGLVIGEVPAIEYVTKREGINKDRLTLWRHKFRKKSRPLLAVSKDGKQLLIVGGRYEFTEAGIEDR